MTPSTRMLQISSYTFDACILEILVTLTIGGCICIPSQEEKMNDITSAINHLQANITFMTPTFARLIAPNSVPCLKTLILGGEKIMHDDWSRWWGGRRLFGGYGPTECCVICIVKEAKELGSNTSQIGMPVIGSYAVLDDQTQQVSPGDVGELYIAGPHLARGYFDDAAKTRSSFVATPNSLKKHRSQYSKWYKTGDLVRWDVRASGFEYVGRKDTQVKLYVIVVAISGTFANLDQEMGNEWNWKKSKLVCATQWTALLTFPSSWQNLPAKNLFWPCSCVSHPNPLHCPCKETIALLPLSTAAPSVPQ